MAKFVISPIVEFAESHPALLGHVMGGKKQSGGKQTLTSCSGVKGRFVKGHCGRFSCKIVSEVDSTWVPIQVNMPEIHLPEQSVGNSASGVVCGQHSCAVVNGGGQMSNCSRFEAADTTRNK